MAWGWACHEKDMAWAWHRVGMGMGKEVPWA